MSVRTPSSTGPRNGVYRNILKKHRGRIPRPKKSWITISARQAGRLKMARALWRRRHQARKYRKLSRWVRALRKTMNVNQKAFAEAVGVSIITIRRLELGSGHLPSSRAMERLKKVEQLLKES